MQRHLLVFGVLCVGYSLLVPHLPAPPRGGLGTEREQNTARAEAIAHATQMPEVVISGSSVCVRLEPMLPEGWLGLSFTGSGSRVGLEMLARVDARPGLVLLETNTIHAEIARDQVDAVFHRVWYPLRKHVPMLQAVNKPAHLMPRLRHALYPPPPIEDMLEHLGDQANGPQLPPHLFEEMLSIRLRDLQAELHRGPIEPQINRARRQVDALLARGLRVALFEIPEHPRAYDTPFKKLLRSRLRRAFPLGGDVAWVPDADPREYQTTEGVHLNTTSAAKYMRHLRDWVSEHRSR